MSGADNGRFMKLVEGRRTGNTGDGTPPGDDDVEVRLAKLETHFEYVRRDLDVLKVNVGDHRKETRSDFRVLFGALIAVALGLAGLMAKGFGWL